MKYRPVDYQIEPKSDPDAEQAFNVVYEEPTTRKHPRRMKISEIDAKVAELQSEIDELNAVKQSCLDLVKAVEPVER